jgi:thiamine pyrophosphate-dependent acetolactate synthase large subunit-like protein
MKEEGKTEGLNRRGFLAGATAAGIAVVPLTKTSPVSAQETQNSSAPLPNAAEAAMEHETPAGYSEVQAANYFVAHPGSDFMVDVLKALDFDYLALNPGSAFRGLHESVLNFGGNTAPEILTCVHEEHAAAIAHGYAKVAKKPMAIACHGTVGIQHAAMAVYNAYADRVPMFILAADHGGIGDRTSQVLWTHTARDPLSPIKDYIKWDDYPRSLQHFGESAVRAFRYALTPPMGPVGIVMDTHLQEADLHEHGLEIPKVIPPTRPLGDPNAVEEAARLLANAESPVLIADRLAQDQEGVDLLVELAELLQAPVVDQKGRMNFPNMHYLKQGGGVVGQADVILGLEVRDTWGVINRLQDAPDHTLTRAARPDAKVISIGTTEINFGSNYQDFTRFYPSDLSIVGDAQATLPYLIEAVREQLNASRRRQIASRQERWQAAHAARRSADIEAARYAWDASPISTSRMCMELWDLVKDKDWALTAPDNLHGSWESRLWNIDRHYQTNGTSGAYGQGYGASSAVGAALAHREHGRLPICITGDGDTMYVPGVHWTAAHHRIPLLTVVHNNRSYHQEVMHVQKTANWRQRGVDKGVEPGNILDDPPIDFAGLAKSLGVWSAGPISSPHELRPALAQAIDVVEQGEPALVDVISQPR